MEVLNKIDDLVSNNKIPIIEGGSGFYLRYILTSQNIFNPKLLEDCFKEAKQIVSDYKIWDDWFIFLQL